MVLNRDNFALHLDRLQEYYRQILFLAKKHSSEEFESNWEVQDKIERKLQLTLECMLDLGDIVISGYGLSKPATYREIVEVLIRKKVIQSNADALLEFSSFRNVLVHDYLVLDRKRVWKNFMKLQEVLPTFIEEMKKYVKKDIIF